jgi:osmotically-inducible protein OsmY
MPRFHRLLAISCVLAMPMALGGCVGALVLGGLGAAAGGGYVAGQERGVDGAASDFAVKTDIEKAFIETNPQLQIGVTTTVYGGRVLLTGRVPSEQLKMVAAQIAGRTHDVRTVYNELEIAPKDVWDDTKDAWITTRVRSEMVLDPDIRSVNYTIDTANGAVYLIGSARSQGELDRATRIARYVPGVRRVVSYVELRSGAPVAAMPPASSGMGSNMNMMPDQPMASPTTPIQVQKL